MIGIDGRRNHAVLTVKRPERQLPSLFAREIVRDQSEIGEEDIDVLPIGDGGRGRAVIERVLGCVPGGADGSPPLDLAGGTAQAHGNQVIALGSGEENAIPHQDGGGLSDGQIRLPQNIFLRPKLGGEAPAGRAESGTVGTTKLGPIGAE